MPLSFFEGALGGVGLFLLGMRFMSDGIRTVADDRIRKKLSVLTSNRAYTLILGIAMSLSINSASAAVIFTIGLVNGGVLSAHQALNLLGGVLIGSSLALHFPVIPYSLVSTPLLFTGVLLKFFARRRRLANTGDLLLGIGLLFLGLSLLEGSFKPIASHPLYAALSDLFFTNQFLSFIFGGLISCLVQSVLSSVSVISALTDNNHLSIAIAYVMVFGGFVGVAVMGCFASVAGHLISRRIALAFLLVILAISVLLSVVVPLSVNILSQMDIKLSVQSKSGLYSQLTWIHTFASLIMACSILVLSGFISRIVGVSDFNRRNLAASQPCAGYLDARILNTPILAIEQARKEITRMISVASFMYADVRELLSDFDARRADTIRQHEQVLDSLNHEITSFLAILAHSSKSPEISYDIPSLLQTVSDVEHIGDRCEEILERIVAKKEAGVIFSDAAMKDLQRIADAVGRTFVFTGDLLRFGNKPGENEIRSSKDALRNSFERIKQDHFERISSGICPPRSALFFIELSTSFIGVAELCWNIMAAQGRKIE
ncbi:MAG TPA: Na/Pi symporter [Negativicutes bacterium]|jgi:phosphate:Na+ symporter